MAGSFTLDTGSDQQSAPLSQPFTPLAVALYERDAKSYTLLPNVWCESIEHRNGATPSVAHFRYILDSTDPNSPFPQNFTQFFPLDSYEYSNYAVSPDDELVVFGYTAAGDRRVLFDGFVQSPQADVEGPSQSGTFVAAGVEVRCWDTPIINSVWRDGDVSSAAGNPKVVDLAPHFNPVVKGEPKANCTPDGYDENQGEDNAYPVFVDANVIRNIPLSFWTLPKFVNYLLGTSDPLVQDFVVLPDAQDVYNTDSIDSLVAIQPDAGEGSGFVDPNDPSTYQVEQIYLRDYDCTGKAWPDAIQEQLNYYGFDLRFELSADKDGNPSTALRYYRRDDLGAHAPKQLNLQAVGATYLDPSQSNTAALHLARDHQPLANAFTIQTSMILYEVGVVLAPGFEILDTDADNPSQFDTSNISKPGTTDAEKNAYRLYIADECGDGHWSYQEDALVMDQPFDFSSILLRTEGTVARKTYVHRYRPGRGTLLSRNDQGKRIRSGLAISRDYTGAVPGLWDGSGTWDYVGTEGWHLLHDWLGIRITAEKLNAWKIAQQESSTQVPGGIVRAVDWQASPGETGSPDAVFYLMLVTVIEDDLGLQASADRRSASPSSFEIRRLIEARDQFRQESITPSSPFWTAQGQQNERDDTDKATSYAESLRSAHEFPPITGTITIPQITNAYSVGDRLSVVAGVDVSLQTNAGTEQGEAPFYPMVVARTWSFSGDGQKTTLHINDRREGNRPPAWVPGMPSDEVIDES